MDQKESPSWRKLKDMVEKELPEEVYKLTPEEEALVLEGLADVEAGRVMSFEQVKEELAQYILTADEERQVVAAEEQVKLGQVHTTEEVLQGLKEIRAEWIKKNPRSA